MLGWGISVKYVPGAAVWASTMQHTTVSDNAYFYYSDSVYSTHVGWLETLVCLLKDLWCWLVNLNILSLLTKIKRNFRVNFIIILGTQIRNRICLDSAGNMVDEMECSGAEEQSRDCNRHNCYEEPETTTEPITTPTEPPAFWAQWQQWTTCSRTCDGGRQHRR